MADYVPDNQPVLRIWAANFAARIAAAPATYGLVAADATAITAAVNAFTTAFQTANEPSTRTKPAVAAKDAAMAFMLSVVRPYAINIRNNLAVSNEDKADLGLTIVDTGRTPVPAPVTQPILSVVGATPGVHTLRYADASTPARRAKPFGAVALQVYRLVAAAAGADVNAAQLHAQVTRQPFTVAFEPADNGKVCTYWGRWVTRTGLVGPWSAPVSFGVAW
jgi:hypothetical protein